MINFAHTPEDTGNGLDNSPEADAPTMPESLARRFSGATHKLVDPQIKDQPGFFETQDLFRGHLDVPQTKFVPRAPLQPALSRSVVPQSGAEPEFNPGAIARSTSKAFAGAGALVGTVTAGSYLAATGISMEAAGLAAGIAAPVAVSAAIATGSTYLGGVLHNLVWHRPGGKKPGFWGTLARGVIAPVSVPVGIAYRLVKG